MCRSLSVDDQPDINTRLVSFYRRQLLSPLPPPHALSIDLVILNIHTCVFIYLFIAIQMCIDHRKFLSFQNVRRLSPTLLTRDCQHFSSRTTDLYKWAVSKCPNTFLFFECRVLFQREVTSSPSSPLLTC